MPSHNTATLLAKRHVANRAHAHIYRQIEMLTEHFAVLSHYMGQVAFEKLAANCINSESTSQLSLRRDCQNLLLSLADSRTQNTKPELLELAQLQTAMHAAFEAPEQKSFHDLAETSDLKIYQTEFDLHPSVQLLQFCQNTTSLWAALICHEVPPRPYKLDTVQHVAVWRQKNIARYRILGASEAAALSVLRTSHKLLEVESLLKKTEGEGNCVRHYFAGWVAADMILECSSGWTK